MRRGAPEREPERVGVACLGKGWRLGHGISLPTWRRHGEIIGSQFILFIQGGIYL